MTEPATPLVGRMGLLQATASNMLVMIGIGPFLTLPFMVSSMGGPHIIYAWIVGAILAICDGLVYAHLGAAFPGSGGPYVYLREAFKPLGLGRLFGFVFLFQVALTAPLSIAGGAVGFADYLKFYWTTMTPLQHDLCAGGLCVLMTALLYRNIESVGRLSVAMLAVVAVTVGWVAITGLVSFSWQRAFDFPAHAYRLDGDLIAKTGGVALLAMYNYGGYNNVCNIGDELRDPHKTMPLAILASVLLVVAIYVVTSTVILGTLPWQEVQASRTIASHFIARTFTDPAHGQVAAKIMNVLVLFVTAASLYALILGYSRIPYAAARDGQFFRIFARTHPTKHFPHVSLLAIGALSIPFCFLSLGKLLTWLILVQILMQFIWQCAAVILLRTHGKDVPQPFRMWLFPLPALIALGMWIYVFVSAPRGGILFALGVLVAAVPAYYFGIVRRRQAPR